MSETLGRLSSALADRYEIERELGQGGMATVYLAHDVRHDRKVALKVLRPELSAILGGERFLQEIKTTANLQHPHILPLHDSGEAGGSVFYVMPYVDGESLRDRLARERQLPVEDAVRIAREVADALDYAHRRGVVHRDIKPENILLHDGRALVADFGIALAASRSEGGARMTETGMSLGTPHYMSPEQAMGERDITPRSDVYALGCVAYEMLMGEPPFTGPTAQAIIAKVMTDEPHGMTLHRKTIPPHVEVAVLHALNKLPADRFASAAEFGAALEGRLAALPSTRAMAATTPARPWRLVALVAIALAAVAGGVAGWALRSPPAQRVVRVSVAFPVSERLRVTSTRRLTIARDGSRIAYIGPGQAGTQIWVRELNALEARALPGTENGAAPFFSPDGRSVGFFTGNPGDVRVVRVDGGPAVTVVRDSAFPFGGDWGDDGYIYFNNQESKLARVPVSGGAVEVLSDLDSAAGHTEYDWPQALPGGRKVLTQIWRSSIGDAQIGILDIATRRVKPVIDATYGRYTPTGHIVYVTVMGSLLMVPFDVRRGEVTGPPVAVADGVQVDSWAGSGQFDVADNGTLLYQLGGGPGSEQVVWVDRDGSSSPVDTAWFGTFSNLALSPDGRYLAVSVASSDGQQIWVKQMPAGPLTRLTFGGTANVRPVWTPDGRRIAFVSNRHGGRRNLFIQRFDGSAEAESLMADRRQVDEVAFTRDARTLLFRTGSGGSRSRDLYALRPGTDSAPRQLVSGVFDEFGATISPDGRWFAYVSNESGRNEVYVRRLDDPGAGRSQVSVDGGEEPLWSHSGRELFFRTRRGDMLVAAVTTTPTFAAQRPRLLFNRPNFGTDSNHRFYTLAADDRRFVMVNRSVREVVELVLVLNWFQELSSLSAPPRRQ